MRYYTYEHLRLLHRRDCELFGLFLLQHCANGAGQANMLAKMPSLLLKPGVEAQNSLYQQMPPNAGRVPWLSASLQQPLDNILRKGA